MITREGVISVFLIFVIFLIGILWVDGAKRRKGPTHYVHCNSGGALFVKEAEFFEDQGGLTEKWGEAWRPVTASSIGDARRQAARMFGVPLSKIHRDEL